MAKGFTQHEMIDFHDTFSLVAKLTSIRCLPVVVAYMGWDLQQLDVNNTFLDGDLEEEIYKKPPLVIHQQTPTRYVAYAIVSMDCNKRLDNGMPSCLPPLHNSILLNRTQITIFLPNPPPLHLLPSSFMWMI